MDIKREWHAHLGRFEKQKERACNPKKGYETGGAPVFAQGYNFYKLVWIFIMASFIGDVIETIYVYLVSGELMSRSSFLYGQFSAVWGLGAVVLTMGLHRLIGWDDRYIFICGFFLGGAYEYACSVATELVFGKVFWDYSAMRFNIGGRTNLLFMFFWGALSVIWLKICYPWLSDKIERIPMRLGKPLTLVLLLFLMADALVSTAALYRMNTRQTLPAKNAVERFVDEQYSDEYLYKRYRNMRPAA